MKVCWDNIEDVYLSRNGNLRKGGQVYIEIDECKICGDFYLARKFGFEKGIDRFCSRECYAASKIGTHHTEESKIKISNANKGQVSSMLGKKHKEESRKKMSVRQLGEKHHNYKGGVHELDIPLFDTFAEKIDYVEQVRYNYEDGLKVLQVKCSKCRIWFTPTRSSVWRRIYALEGKKGGECRFYCSDKCKANCGVFNQKKYPKEYKQEEFYTEGELQIWRKEVLRRTDYKCEYCGEPATDAHHTRPKKLEPFFALDPDYGIACCEKCHYQYGHKDECSTGALALIICGGGK